MPPAIALSELAPRYHVVAERHWLNDPNGPVYWRGRHHLFFQANPVAPRWGPPHWGHVSSADLVHWRRHPIALTPAPGPDADGCWSGCARVEDGRPTLYYTGVVGEGDEGRVESVCRASATDDELDVFHKDPANPLIPGPPPSWPNGFHRDPFLWRDDDGTGQLLLGSSRELDGVPGGAVLRYERTGRDTWRFAGVFAELTGDERASTGPMWECPQLFEAGEGRVLIFSVQQPEHARPLRGARALHGVVRDGRLRPTGASVAVDHGDVFYAPAVLPSAAAPAEPRGGRTLLWGWVQEPAPAGVEEEMGRVGALSLPRVVGWDASGLRVAPAPELLELRHGEPSGSSCAFDGRAPQVLAEARRQQEIAVVVEGRGTAEVRIDLDPTGTEHVDVVVDRRERSLVVDRAAASLRRDVPAEPCRAPLGPEDGGRTHLRILVDGSILELFADDRVALTTRVYPTSLVLGHVTVRACSDARLRHASVWDLRGGVQDGPVGAPPPG